MVPKIENLIGYVCARWAPAHYIISLTSGLEAKFLRQNSYSERPQRNNTDLPEASSPLFQRSFTFSRVTLYSKGSPTILGGGASAIALCH